MAERSFWEYDVRDRLQERAARVVYLDLCEGRPQWSVKHFYDKDLEMVCLKAAFNEPRAPGEIVVPVCSMGMVISPEKIEEWNSVSPDNRIVMALVTEDGEVLYYDVVQGFNPPPLPEEAQAEKLRREKRRILRQKRQHELNHRKDEIVEQAGSKRDSTSLARIAQEEMTKAFGV